MYVLERDAGIICFVAAGVLLWIGIGEGVWLWALLGLLLVVVGWLLLRS